MDVQKLNNLKHWLEYSSFTLGLENYIILTNSLLLLQSENHFKKTLFWGLIQGLEADYFISFGYEKDALTERKYFYSDDCQNWKLLPVPQREHLALTELCKRPFQGDPGLVVEVVDDAPPDVLFPDQKTSILGETEAASTIQTEGEEPDENKVEEQDENKVEEEEEVVEEEARSKTVDEDDDSRKSKLSAITSGELKEEDRLAAIVHIITDEAAVIPRGGIFKQTDGTSVLSRAFEGIKLEDADSLCSFQHYRVPWNDCNTNLLMRCDYNYAIDFLDTIDKDIPADCWSAQLVEGDRTLILRNMHWPGFMFFHYLDSPDHGFVYIGQGQRNVDIPFMTQVMLPIKPATEEEITVDEEEEPTGSLDEEYSRPSKLSQHSTRLSTKLNTKLDSKLGTRLGTTTGTRLETTTGTRLATTAGTRLETTTGTRLETTTGTRLATTTGTRLDSTTGRRLETTTGTKLQTKLGTKLQSKLGTKLGTILSEQSENEETGPE